MESGLFTLLVVAYIGSASVSTTHVGDFETEDLCMMAATNVAKQFSGWMSPRVITTCLRMRTEEQ
jgi:hypothetical protein